MDGADPTATDQGDPTMSPIATTPTSTPAVTPEQELDPVYLLADTDPPAMKAMNAELVAGFRAQGGHLGGDFDGVPLLLLTTMGARTGRVGTTPLNYTRDGANYVVVASKSGSARHPDWYHNLLAHPEATVEVPGAVHRVRARITNGGEREQLFARHAAALPNFVAYQKRTTRELPVIVLEVIG
jgi:deazaflavin-dependent oxidoreductase (nitroreductase family)